MMDERLTERTCVTGGWARAVWLLADALIFGLVMYKVIEYALLYVDGVAEWHEPAAALTAGAAAIVAARLVWLRGFGESFAGEGGDAVILEKFIAVRKVIIETKQVVVIFERAAFENLKRHLTLRGARSARKNILNKITSGRSRYLGSLRTRRAEGARSLRNAAAKLPGAAAGFLKRTLETAAEKRGICLKAIGDRLPPAVGVFRKKCVPVVEKRFLENGLVKFFYRRRIEFTGPARRGGALKFIVIILALPLAVIYYAVSVALPAAAFVFFRVMAALETVIFLLLRNFIPVLFRLLFFIEAALFATARTAAAVAVRVLILAALLVLLLARPAALIFFTALRVLEYALYALLRIVECVMFNAARAAAGILGGVLRAIGFLAGMLTGIVAGGLLAAAALSLAISNIYTLVYGLIAGIARVCSAMTRSAGKGGGAGGGSERKESVRAEFIASVAMEVLFVGAAALALSLLSQVSGKGQSFTWVPLEWHKYPYTFKLFLETSPALAALVAVVVVAGSFAISSLGRAWTVPPASLALLFAWKQCTTISKEDSFILYFFIYLAPLALLVAALWLRRERAAMRLLAYCGFPFMMMTHYCGWTPYIRDMSFTGAPGVVKIYPREGAAAEFPLAYLRDFSVDPEEKILYTSYGPTSGVIRLDLKTGGAQVLDTPNGTVRYIQLTPDPDKIYALDSMNFDLLTVRTDPLRITGSENASFGNGLVVPFHFILKGGKLYATYTERPGFAEFDMEPLKPRRKILFREAGVTKFGSGVMLGAVDAVKDKIFIEVGMTDGRDRFSVVRVDLEDFRIDGKAEIPEGGLELIALPEKRKVLATSFYSDRIYEIDMDTMETGRVLHGPVSCRSLVYDARRDMLIGTGFLSGELRFIDYATGRTLKAGRVGNKAGSLELGPGGDRVYLGSSWGIFSVDIDKYAAR